MKHFRPLPLGQLSKKAAWSRIWIQREKTRGKPRRRLLRERYVTLIQGKGGKLCSRVCEAQGPQLPNTESEPWLPKMRLQEGTEAWAL